jgi:hypothetical protein
MTSRFSIGLVALALICSCKTATSDPKKELLAELNGANVQGYAFASFEDDANAMASLTNGAIESGLTLAKGDTLPLRYATLKDKKANTTKTYKTAIVRDGTSLSLLTTDLANSRVIDRQSFPTGPGPDLRNCGTFTACGVAESDYNDNQKPLLQAEANRTCHEVRGGYTCRISPGNCVIVDTFVAPNSPRCEMRRFMVDIDKLSLKRQ